MEHLALERASKENFDRDLWCWILKASIWQQWWSALRIYLCTFRDSIPLQMSRLSLSLSEDMQLFCIFLYLTQPQECLSPCVSALFYQPAWSSAWEKTRLAKLHSGMNLIKRILWWAEKGSCKEFTQASSFSKIPLLLCFEVDLVWDTWVHTARNSRLCSLRCCQC